MRAVLELLLVLNGMGASLQDVKRELEEEGRSGREIGVIEGGMAFLKYFERQWLETVDGWTLEQRKAAADVLGIAVEMLATTNNHVEGFHSALKAAQLVRCGEAWLVSFFRRFASSDPISHTPLQYPHALGSPLGAIVCGWT